MPNPATRIPTPDQYRYVHDQADSGRLTALLPLSELEHDPVLAQIHDVLQLAEVRRLALMPDVHLGYDLCVGGVAEVDGHISPSFVGVDKGCGMSAIPTHLLVSEVHCNDLTRWYTEIYRNISVGLGGRGKMSAYLEQFTCQLGDKDLEQQVNKAAKEQFGTPGDGNHFISIDVDEHGKIWIVIHCGSRQIGQLLYKKYTREFSRLIPIDSDPGRAYYHALQFAERFAKHNRGLMLRQILGIIGYDSSGADRIFETGLINENHNHAIIDESTGYVLHRKGATPADEGQMGIIPGNMRDGTYLTVGLGNDKYLSSASHGAGRAGGRAARKNQLVTEHGGTEAALAWVRQDMGDILYPDEAGVLDEVSSAYKALDQVMARQQDIVVAAAARLRPLAVVKGVGKKPVSVEQAKRYVASWETRLRREK